MWMKVLAGVIVYLIVIAIIVRGMHVTQRDYPTE